MMTLNLRGISCLILLCAIFFSSQGQNSNVSIGTESLKERAILWLKAEGNQGLLLPVVGSRAAFTGLNNTDDKGMLIYDASDNKVYYWNGSAWVEAGGGASGSNQTLTLAGNTFTLSGSPASTINLSSSAPAPGQALVWNGSAWAAVSTNGDVTGTTTATVVSGIKGKSLPATLPSGTNALVYDGAAWAFQPLSAVGEANTASNVGTAGVGIFKQKSGDNLEFQKINAGSNKITVTQDIANSEVDIDINQINISIASTQVTGLGSLASLSAITSAQITDGTITNSDISPTANILVTKLSAGTNGQVLSVVGGVPTWSSPSGSGTVTNIATGTGLTGGPITGTGTISIAPAGVTATELADNSVTSTKIANSTITGIDIAPTTITADKLAQSGAASGQVLKWNGTNWVPQNDDVGAGAVPTLNAGQILVGDGSANSAAALSGDATLAGGVITIANNAVTTAKINAGAVDNTKLADNSVTTIKVANNAINSAKIIDASITGADIALTTITADKLAQSGANATEVLQWNGTNWVPAAVGTGTVTSVGAGTGLTGGPITTTGTLSIAPLGVTSAELADNAVTSAKIVDGAIVNADVSASAAIAGTKVNPAFGAQNVSTTGSGDFSRININTSSGSNESIMIGLSTPGATANQGIRVNVGGSTNTNYGVYPYVGGGSLSYGVHAFSESSSTAGYAVYGNAFGNSPLAYGVYGNATGSATNYGVFGQATGGTLNWAGYFSGNTAITGGLAVGGSNNYGTLGQILTSQGPGTAPVWAATASSFTTANQVPRGNGTSLVTSNIYSTGTNVGIGASAPRSILELQGGNLILSGSPGGPNDPVDIDFKTLADVFKAKIWTDPNSNTLWFSTSTAPISNKHMTINPNGLIGIGTTAPSTRLHVGDYNVSANDEYATVATQGGNLYRSGVKLRHFNDNYGWTIESDERLIYNGTSALIFTNHFNDAVGSARLYILSNGWSGFGRVPMANILEVEGDASKTVAGTWIANSDRRIKTDIQEIDNSFDLLKKLRPVKFKYTPEWKAKHPSIKDHYYYNFIAQEYQEVFPESVKKSGENLEGEPEGILQIDTYNAQITTIRAVQELIRKVEALEAENQKLKAENDTLETKLSSYEEQQNGIRKELDEIKALLMSTSSKNTEEENKKSGN